MQIFFRVVRFCLALPLSVAALADTGEMKELKPEDRPFTAKPGDIDREIAPFVALSRQQYPEARRRFLTGLPDGSKFLVTIKIWDEAERFENVFVHVLEIHGQTIKGTLASEPNTVQAYELGDRIECSEDSVLDWTIVHSNGKEEGNYVGKFLDVLLDGRVPLIVQLLIAEDGRVRAAQFDMAINRYKQDVSYCVPEEAKREAETMFRARQYDARPAMTTNFAYVIYDWTRKKIEEINKVQPQRRVEPSSAGAPEGRSR